MPFGSSSTSNVVVLLVALETGIHVHGEFIVVMESGLVILAALYSISPSPLDQNAALKQSYHLLSLGIPKRGRK